jgi:putative transposase
MQIGCNKVSTRTWMNELGVSTLFIEPGRSWENGYIESFNGKMGGELLNREIFYTLQEARVIIEQWQKDIIRFDHTTR